MNPWPIRSTPPPIAISPISLCAMGGLTSNAFANYASAVWPLANRALFYPFVLEVPVKVVTLFVANGSAVSGHFDIGIYSLDGTVRKVSTGSTSQSGTNARQDVTVSTNLAAGEYLLGLAFDNITATTLRQNAGAPALERAGVYQQDSAFVLPTSLTLVSPAAAYLPMFGLLNQLEA